MNIQNNEMQSCDDTKEIAAASEPLCAFPGAAQTVHLHAQGPWNASPLITD